MRSAEIPALKWAVRGRSSVGRASASQAEGRGFDPRRPLRFQRGGTSHFLSRHPDLRDTERAMSQENVEVVERAVAAVNDRDIDGYLACCTEDIQLQTPVSPIEGT